MQRLYRSVVWLSMLILAGCGGGDKQDIPLSVGATGNEAGSSTTPANSPSDQANETNQDNHPLVGQWKGRLKLDEQAAKQLLTPEQIAELQTMTMEIEFSASGEMGMLAVIQRDGTPLETSSIGTWSVVGANGNHFTVRSQEPDGATEDIVIQMPNANTILMDAQEMKELGAFELTRQ